MSEKNDKLIKNSKESKENKVEEITGEDVNELKDEELEQASGGWFPVFDECQKRYDKRLCSEGIIPAVTEKCPHYREERAKKEGNYWVQYASCKRGYFKELAVYRVEALD